ncbi:MAG: LytTR family DNA-binding domain-containing protein [Hungatella sp.]|jgi:DNA-binding LytR/AlgR family response regulator|nr:LytTR family DNA-binding domain-containing protein [Hungatella sp.]
MCRVCRKIKIAICDDEIAVCNDLEEKIIKCCLKLNVEINIEQWYSGEKLCDYLREGTCFDIIFLDIKLFQMSGIDIGCYIREEIGDIKTQIVYISSRQNYALQLFNTQPFDFLVKPIAEEKIYNLMSKIQKIIIAYNRFFVYQSGRELYWVDFDKILYFKSGGRRIQIVLAGKEIEYYGKLNDIIKNVPSFFLRIHKSYLVNKNYITRYNFEFVEIITKQILTISKPYQKSIRQKIMDSNIDTIDFGRNE